MLRNTTSLVIAIAIAFSASVYAQNVGVGISSPLQKLHIGGTSNTLRIDGLSSTGTMFGSLAATERIVFVTSSGDLKALTNGTNGQVLTISGSGVPAWATSSGSSDWTLSGNSIAGTEFIGTTNTQPFIIKTNNAERSRFLSGGQFLINQTVANVATQLTEATASGTYTTAIAGYTSSSSGYGIIGYNSAAAGKALVGLNNATAGTTQAGSGVTGQIAQGASSAPSYGGFGVSGINTSSSGFGVSGIGQNTPTITYTTSGAGGIFNGTSRGSYHAANTAPGNGAFALGAQGIVTVVPTGTGFTTGLRGDATASSGTADGVEGVTTSSGGLGVYGANSAAGGDAIVGYSTATTSNGFGVYGISGSTASVGVAGYSGANGVIYFAGSGGAFGGDDIGASGWASTNSGTGIYGIGNNLSTGLQTSAGGSGGAFNSDVLGIYSYCTSNSNGNAAGYFQSGSGTTNYAYVAYRTAGTNYAINGNGTKATIVYDLNNQPVIMACPEAPEILFEDYGSGRLVNGKAHIELDPIYVKNVAVNEKHPLRVFIQLEGNCQGVYVTNKSSHGFDVIELNAGQSDVPFTWHVAANRADARNDQGEVISYSQDNRWAPAQEILGHQAVSSASNKNKVVSRELPNDENVQTKPK